MPKNRTLAESYDECMLNGNIVPQERIDISRIKSMIQIASDDLESAKSLVKGKEPKYNSIYKLYYDVLHQLAEALLLFDKVKSFNHQCLFAYICAKHPELEFDWNFFEKIRTKRNGISYYGSQISETEWKESRLQLEIYIKALSDAVSIRIKNYN